LTAAAAFFETISLTFPRSQCGCRDVNSIIWELWNF